ncbi:hypothetical protein D3C86_1925920 [compost metagenome]
MIALSGVRISWLTRARNSVLWALAVSAARLAFRSSSSVRFHWVMSRITAQKPLEAESRPMVMNSGRKPPFASRPITSRPSFSTLATPWPESPCR